MTAQIIHEAENTRQHARYKIPAKLLIDQQLFKLENWSVSGLAVKLPNKISQSQQLKGRLVFDFGEMETTIDIEIEEVHRNLNQDYIGYRIINQKRAHIAILHHIINAYLNGDIVDAGAMIEIVKRDAFTVIDKDKKVAQISGSTNQLIFRLRQSVGNLALLVLFLSLISFIGYSLYNRIFIINSVAGTVTADVVVVRSPRPSYFDALPVMSEGAIIKTGDLLATLRLINGGAANIESPCDCKIYTIHVPHKQFVDKGEPLLTMIPEKGGDLFIEAKFNVKDVGKLSLNQRATIQFVNGTEITGTIRKIVSGETVEFKHSTPLKNIASNPVSYANVLIYPDSKIAINLLGSVAAVSINSLESKD